MHYILDDTCSVCFIMDDNYFSKIFLILYKTLSALYELKTTS